MSTLSLPDSSLWSAQISALGKSLGDPLVQLHTTYLIRTVDPRDTEMALRVKIPAAQLDLS